MKRTRNPSSNRPADAILVSDLHLTDRTPVSRTDDYQEAQRRKLEFICKLSKENGDCPVLCAGDVFDYWKASPWLCRFAVQNLPADFLAIPGQHDLPGHSLAEFEKSGLGLLDVVEAAAVLKSPSYFVTARSSHNTFYVVGIPYGQLEDVLKDDFEFPKTPSQGRRILLLHTLVWPDRRPSWDKSGITAKELLERFGKQFDLIVTGDNHQSFVYEGLKSLLVNPGSMLRITADQEDHRPRCYLYYADTNSVQHIYLPIEKGVINREHIESRKKKDERIAAYIERMNTDWEITLSFRRNLEAFFNENKVPRSVREIIWRAMEGTNN